MQAEQMVFQFHYGSIKIDLFSNFFFAIFVFQFHYGSIKIRLPIVLLTSDFGFNSTMVRLKWFVA